MSSRESRAVVHSSARRRRWSKETAPDMSDLRIVLLGKSVSENSLVGNFLLGRAAFDSEAPPDVVERVGGRLKDRHVMVINSPQLLQTNISDHQITQTVRECVNLSDPGPHVIILLLKHDQCSAEDQECVQKVLDSFSECVYQHTMVLTTQEPTETNDILQKIIQKCFNRHFSLQRSSSPDDLLQMFEDIVTINDGRHLVCAEGSQYFTMEQQATERLSECLKLNLVVCGSDGTLKSSISELILRDVELHGRQISLVDLPALFNTRLSEEEVMRQTLCCVSLCHPGVHVFLLIVPDAPLNNEDKAEMEEIQRIFSSRINKHMMILIIQSSEHQTAELNEETQSVIESFGGRHHFFGPNTQVSTLMENIEKMLEENRGEFYSTETFLEAQMKKLMKYKEMKKKIHSLETHLLTQGSRENTDEVRIVLLGKTGVGKSATGNTILGRNAFTAETSQESVTKESRRETSEINGRHITVIDTPGLFDTELSNEEIQREIRHCISMILPGPHVFIIVLNLGQRFIKEEATSVKIIQETFGEKSLMYTMVLFTRGDDLKNKTIEQCLGKPGSPLMNLIEACGNRFHVFNNNQTGDRTQVSDLLEKIDNMVTANGGSFYSCKMFREMEREKQEQQMKILMDRDREREEVMKKLEEIRRERETFKNEIDQLKQEKEKIKTEKEKLQIKYDTEIERLRNRIENERQNHETERKKWEEEFDEREERQKTFMKEKEEREEKMCEMKREREEWEKQKLEEKRRREDEDEKRRHEFNQRLKEERERMKREKKDLQSKHDKEEKKMKILMENLNREREELMKKHVEEKERMKMMMEEERQNQDKERKRREEELKGEIREEEKHQREIRDEMRRERETFRHEIEEMKKEKENMKKEKENLKITYNTEIDRLMNRIENERQNHDKEKKRREEEFSEREEQYKREVKEKEELLKKHEEEKDRLKMTMEEERQNQDKQRKRREEEFREREERYKRIIKDREERENKMIEQMKLERMQWEKQKQEERQKREEEKKKQEEEQKSEQSPVSDQRKMSSPQQRIPINIQDIPVADHLLRRIVLLGKSGVGMSAAGNTILGQNEFKSVRSTSSVTSECSEAHVTVSGRSVSVVDTPGFVDTQIKPEYLVTGMARSVYISSPGPHAFLIVFDVNMRFSEQEQQIPEMIKMMFGQEVLKYSIILFTHGDQIEGESVEELIEENSALSHLVDQCGGRYHVFNNKDQRNREQVNDLLQKIDTMIEQNGGGYYSTEMFEEVQRFRCEEEERRQEVEKQIQEEIERLRKEREEKIRAEMRAEYESLESERQREERKQQNLNCVCS